MRVGITGAAGFVGSGLLSELLGRGTLGEQGAPLTTIVAIDVQLPHYADPSVHPAEGDIADPEFRAGLFSERFDVFFHLAAIPGGAASRDYALGWRVNVDATVGLVECLARQETPGRLVFLVHRRLWRAPAKGHRRRRDIALPTMSYGAQKLIGETLLADFSRRGLVDGLGVRLPGIVARPMMAGGHLSAYPSNIFHALAVGDLPKQAEAGLPRSASEKPAAIHP